MPQTPFINENGDRLIYIYPSLDLSLSFNEMDILIKIEINAVKNSNTFFFSILKELGLQSISKKEFLEVYSTPTKLVSSSADKSTIFLFDKKTYWQSFNFIEDKLIALHFLSDSIIPKGYKETDTILRLCRSNRS
jgi:hypothetical protein